MCFRAKYNTNNNADFGLWNCDMNSKYICIILWDTSLQWQVLQLQLRKRRSDDFDKSVAKFLMHRTPNLY